MDKILTVKYQDYRQKIKTGSCLLFKGTKLFSRFLMLFTDYSHAALILKLDQYTDLKERVFLSETRSQGTVLTLMSNRIKDGDVFIFEPRGLTPELEIKIATTSLINAADDIKYDYDGLFNNVLGRIPFGSEDFFCSGYVWYEWILAGLIRPENLTELGIKSVEKNLVPRPGDIPKWIHGSLIKIEE